MYDKRFARTTSTNLSTSSNVIFFHFILLTTKKFKELFIQFYWIHVIYVLSYLVVIW